jgi:hypothetical protein
VNILDFSKYNEAFIPLAVLLGETLLVWILVVVLINRRCLRSCPKLRASNETVTATSAEEAKFFQNVMQPSNLANGSIRTSIPREKTVMAPVSTSSAGIADEVDTSGNSMVAV